MFSAKGTVVDTLHLPANTADLQKALDALLARSHE
jgi:hypothetical protein